MSSWYNQFYFESIKPSVKLKKFKPQIIYIHSTSVNIDEYPSIGCKNKDKTNFVLNGGPVEITKLFILHDDALQKESISNVNGLCLTSSLDFLKDIGKGKNNCNYKLALGYCGWDAGQLDYEISRNSWHIIDFDSQEIFRNKSEDLISVISKTKGFDIDKIQNTDIITKH